MSPLARPASSPFALACAPAEMQGYLCAKPLPPEQLAAMVGTPTMAAA